MGTIKEAKSIEKKIYNSFNRFEFAVKKEVLKGGEVIFTPLFREKSKWKILSGSGWTQIVKLYDEYILLDHPGQHNLTFETCIEHIEGYKQKLLLQQNGQLTELEILQIHEHDAS